MKHDTRLHRLRFKAVGNAIRSRSAGAAIRELATISACSQTILTHYGIDSADPGEFPAAAFRAGIEIHNVRSLDAHLTMTIVLPMAWSGRQMTIATNDPATIRLPGMTFSPAIAAAALGRPVGRLLGHPAFDGRPDMLVTGIEHVQDAGVNSAILHFRDGTEPLDRRFKAACEVLH